VSSWRSASVFATCTQCVTYGSPDERLDPALLVHLVRAQVPPGDRLAQNRRRHILTVIPPPRS
jgi:hypothetical protein